MLVGARWQSVVRCKAFASEQGAACLAGFTHSVNLGAGSSKAAACSEHPEMKGFGTLWEHYLIWMFTCMSAVVCVVVEKLQDWVLTLDCRAAVFQTQALLDQVCRRHQSGMIVNTAS